MAFPASGSLRHAHTVPHPSYDAMASIGHIAVGMAAGRWWASRTNARPTGAMAGFAALSLLPDADVLGMAFGVPYGAPWGHRGATHSLVMAFAVAVASLAVARRGQWRIGAAVLVFAVVASHGLLDAMTDGGKGVALLWPITTQRFFFAWRPIPVAPIGVGFVSMEGLRVALWEALAFSPLFLFALWPRPSRTTAREDPRRRIRKQSAE